MNAPFRQYHSPPANVARLGPYAILPREGHLDQWVLPGGRVVEWDELEQIAWRNGWELRGSGNNES